MCALSYFLLPYRNDSVHLLSTQWLLDKAISGAFVGYICISASACYVSYLSSASVHRCCRVFSLLLNVGASHYS
jgi:hypothetical protein